MSCDGPTLKELAELLCTTLRLPPPEPPLSANELLFGGRFPFDSVDSLQWATAVERHFGVELTDEEIGDGVLLTLGRMAQVLESRQLLRGSSPRLLTPDETH